MIKLLSLFSGIGAFEKALTRQKIPFEIVNYCEIDPFASKAYSVLYNVSEDLNLRDVTKIDTSKLKDKEINFITYGYPCQDISSAGKQRGFFDENGKPTRSGLCFEALRIIKDLQPRICIAENVKAQVSKKFKPQFDMVLNCLNEIGYNSYYDVLNAKDFGVPQNRERIFVVSVRKDIDNGRFKFPTGGGNSKLLRDVLEREVDECFYKNDERSKALIQKLLDEGFNPETLQKDKINQIGNIAEEKSFSNPQTGRIYSNNGICPTLNTCGGGNREVKIVEDSGVKVVGNLYSHSQANEVIDPNGISKTLCAGDVTKAAQVKIICAQRGRGNTGERAQQLEPNTTNTTNTLTSVLKDNYVLEKQGEPEQKIKVIGHYSESYRSAQVVSGGGYQSHAQSQRLQRSDQNHRGS